MSIGKVGPSGCCVVDGSVPLRPRARKWRMQQLDPAPPVSQGLTFPHPLLTSPLTPCTAVLGYLALWSLAGSWGDSGTPLHSLQLCSGCHAECQSPGAPGHCALSSSFCRAEALGTTGAGRQVLDLSPIGWDSGLLPSLSICLNLPSGQQVKMDTSREGVKRPMLPRNRARSLVKPSRPEGPQEASPPRGQDPLFSFPWCGNSSCLPWTGRSLG